jgi:cytochrome c peroxidase
MLKQFKHYLFFSLVVFCVLLLVLFSRDSDVEQVMLPMGEMQGKNTVLNFKEKAALGKQLFFDKRLSLTNQISCASCHLPRYAFADRKPLSIGINGRKTMRNTPTLMNVGYQSSLMFDAQIPTLEQQVIVPIQDHHEMGLKMGVLLAKLKNIKKYRIQAKKWFNRDFDSYVLTRSIAAFERTLVSQNSRFDRFMQGNKKALTTDEKAGYRLFSTKLHCTTCHAYPHFTSYQAVNNGFFSKNESDKGRFRIHNDSNDIGKFKVPTLRNIALTAPYMHNGKLASLEEVLKHYERGGNRTVNQHAVIKPFTLSNTERNQLIAFLKTLTNTMCLSHFHDLK